MTTDWRHLAACRNEDPEKWFSNPRSNSKDKLERTKERERARDAIDICRTCPVRKECKDLADSLNAHDGIWAGRYRESRTDRICKNEACGQPLPPDASQWDRHCSDECRRASKARTAKAYDQRKAWA